MKRQTFTQRFPVFPSSQDSICSQLIGQILKASQTCSLGMSSKKWKTGKTSFSFVVFSSPDQKRDWWDDELWMKLSVTFCWPQK